MCFAVMSLFLEKLGVKNIIWDVDGTLANLNHAYYCFIKNHPRFKEFFKKYRYCDLGKALPVERKKYGAMELKNHPILGEELDKAFCESDEYYFDRPLYYGTEKVLKELNKQGYKQFILSAGFDIQKKQKLLNLLFKDFPFIKLEIVKHDSRGMHEGNTKEDRIKELLQKYNLSASETLLVDDRLYNIKAGLSAGIKVVRFRSEFTTPLTEDLKGVIEVEDIREFLK